MSTNSPAATSSSPTAASSSAIGPAPPRVAPIPSCRHAFDRAAYGRDVRPCLPDVLAVARRVLGSDDLAWDAVQEALIALWREPELPADLRGWLVRAALNRSLHASRSERRRRRHEACACGERPELQPELDPALAAEAAERERRLDLALGTLPCEQREVFLLRERESLDYAAIARRLAVPVGTVRSRLARARRGIAHRLCAELTA
jgi:RNA polymerase sigma-70 factor (ECF subfamily)